MAYLKTCRQINVDGEIKIVGPNEREKKKKTIWNLFLTQLWRSNTNPYPNASPSQVGINILCRWQMVRTHNETMTHISMESFPLVVKSSNRERARPIPSSILLLKSKFISWNIQNRQSLHENRIMKLIDNDGNRVSHTPQCCGKFELRMVHKIPWQRKKEKENISCKKLFDTIANVERFHVKCLPCVLCWFVCSICTLWAPAVVLGHHHHHHLFHSATGARKLHQSHCCHTILVLISARPNCRTVRSTQSRAGHHPECMFLFLLGPIAWLLMLFHAHFPPEHVNAAYITQ